MLGTTGYRRLIRRIAGAAALLAAFALPQMAAGQDKIDPQAVKLLKAATDFLASQKALAADTRNTLEIVLTSGQKIQFAHTANVSLQRPNKLRAERTGDLVNQVFYYDGKSLTLWSPGEKSSQRLPLPPPWRRC